MPKAKFKGDTAAILQSILSSFGDSARRAWSGIDSGFLKGQKYDKRLADIIGNRAATMSGKVNPAVLKELLARGGASTVLPGAAVGAGLGFLGAPSTEEENLLGMTKRRNPGIGDRLQYALTGAGLGAAAGAGFGAYNMRNLAKHISEGGADPGLIRQFVNQSGELPGLENTVKGFARQAAGAGKGQAINAAKNAINPQELSNAVMANLDIIRNAYQTKNMSGPQVAAAAHMIQRVTGMDARNLLNNPNATDIINRQASRIASGINKKQFDAIKTMLEKTRGVSSDPAILNSPGTLDRIKAVLTGADEAGSDYGSMRRKAKRFFTGDRSAEDQFGKAYASGSFRGFDRKTPKGKEFEKTLKDFQSIKSPDFNTNMPTFDSVTMGQQDIRRRNLNALRDKALLGLGGVGAGTGLAGGAYLYSQRDKQSSARLSKADKHPLSKLVRGA